MAHFVNLERVKRAGWRGMLLLVEASVALAAAALLLHLNPFRRAIRFGSRSLPKVATDPTIEAMRRIERSVERAAARLPWRTVCLQQGLALQWMLRRRGIDALLHYGIGKDEAGALCAHVWVSVGPTMLIGSAQAPQFQPVATYPS